MAETAVVRYHCPGCQAELEQEGYVTVDALEEGPVAALLSGEINLATCPECGIQSRLPIPLVFHNGERELIMAFVPEVARLSPEELNKIIQYPYSVTATRVAERLGIELPEPDPAAFPRDEEEKGEMPGARFAALTHDQASSLLPAYLLRPTIVDGMEVLVAVAQAVKEGMSAQEVLDDIARLQLINGILSAPDPITRRKVLHHSEPYLNEEFFEVVNTLHEQMEGEGNTEMSEKLVWVKGEVERYKRIQKERLAKNKLKSGAGQKAGEEEKLGEK